MTETIQLRHSSPEVQETLADLDEDDLERITAFLRRVGDYRSALAQDEFGRAARAHDSLLIELNALRDRYSKLSTYVAGGAAAGSAAGAWLFGLGALLGALAGGALGYFAAKETKAKMLKICDALLMELGPRPSR